MSKGVNSSAPTTGEVVAGVYNVTPPVLQDGQGAALQLDVNGKLLTSGGGGSTTQDVNITEIAGSPVGLSHPLPVELSDGTNALGGASNPVRIDPTGTTPQPVTASSLPLPTGAATSANQTNASQKTQIVDGSANVISSTGNALDVNVKTPNPLPVSAASLPLPTGAATSANQTNGTQKSQVVDGSGNVQPAGDTPAHSINVEVTDGTNVLGTSAHPVRTDPTGTTPQPVSGTVTANQGTSPWVDNVTQLAGNAVDTNSGNKSAGTLRVVLATDQPNLTTPLNENVTQLGGNTIDTNSGNKSAGTQRMVIATDQPNLTTPLNVSDTALELAQASTTSGQKGPLVQGAVTTAAPTYVTAQTNPLSLTTGGELRAILSNTSAPVAQITAAAYTEAAATNVPNNFTASGGGNRPGAVLMIVSKGVPNATTSTPEAMRTPSTFKTVNVASSASGNSAVWTPTSGKKFRLMRFQITGVNLAATNATVITVSFQDSSTPITIGTYDVLLPAVATATDLTAGGFTFNTEWIDLGNGFLSAAANNVLNFNVSAAPAGNQGSYRVNVCGTEE